MQVYRLIFMTKRAMVKRLRDFLRDISNRRNPIDTDFLGHLPFGVGVLCFAYFSISGMFFLRLCLFTRPFEVAAVFSI